MCCYVASLALESGFCSLGDAVCSASKASPQAPRLGQTTSYIGMPAWYGARPWVLDRMKAPAQFLLYVAVSPLPQDQREAPLCEKTKARQSRGQAIHTLRHVRLCQRYTWHGAWHVHAHGKWRACPQPVWPKHCCGERPLLLRRRGRTRAGTGRHVAPCWRKAHRLPAVALEAKGGVQAVLGCATGSRHRGARCTQKLHLAAVAGRTCPRRGLYHALQAKPNGTRRPGSR